jgi:hypothetical protein
MGLSQSSRTAIQNGSALRTMTKTNIVSKIRKARRDKSKIKEVLNQKKFQTSKNSRVGNFIKPKPAIHFIGAEPKAAPSEKSEKSR